jgi:hypothetical protein
MLFGMTITAAIMPVAAEAMAVAVRPEGRPDTA